MSILRLLPLPCILLLPSAQAQIVGGFWEEQVFPGEMATQQGQALCPIPDYDGDGVLDLLVGAPRNAPFVAAQGTAFIFSGATGSILWKMNGVGPNQNFGHALARAGDLDGDGESDFLVGAPYFNPWNSSSGYVEAYSGDDGHLLFKINSPFADAYFGHSLGGEIDFDRDGVDDLLIGAPWASPSGMHHAGSVMIYSGATRQLLGQLDGKNGQEEFGWALEVVEDIDQDGTRDIMIGAPEARVLGSGKRMGAVFVHSGADGAPIWRFDGYHINTGYGRALACAGDADGDGVPDLLIGAPTVLNWHTLQSSVHLHSGATGQLLWSRFADADDLLGAALAGVGNLDRDGHDDFAVGAPKDTWVHGASGEVLIYSGLDFTTLKTLTGPLIKGGYGSALASADLRGNGLTSLVVGSVSYGGISSTEIRLHTLQPLLRLDQDHLRAASGDQVLLELDFPASEGWFPYAVLASMSGPGPSTIGGLEVPLAMDSLLLQMMAGWTPPILIGGAGALDLEGDASAVLHGDAALTPLIGRHLSIAALSYDPRFGIGRLSSTHQSLEIVP